MSSMTASSVRSESVKPFEGSSQAARPTEGDARAMRDALDAARQRAALTEELLAESEVLTRIEQPRNGTGGLDGEATTTEPAEFAPGLQTGPASQPATIAAPQAPPPHTDPTAFAAAISQLWAREQAKGSRDIQLRFGDRAWPALGARLVRGPDGVVDVALLVGNGDGAIEARLPELRAALAGRGVTVGALGVTREA